MLVCLSWEMGSDPEAESSWDQCFQLRCLNGGHLLCRCPSVVFELVQHVGDVKPRLKKRGEGEMP